MEKFLEFWSHNNATIIEILVALILISAIYLAYRSFFGEKGVDTFERRGATAGEVPTAEIEKTLQKILEHQTQTKTGEFKAGSGEPPAEMIQELTQLKKSLEEKEKQITSLREKAEAAAVAAKTGGPSEQDIAAAASAAAGLAEKERMDYENRIKELEARLAEYEIISEDIADLSFFKEENARLTKELEALRGGGGEVPPTTSTAAESPAESASVESATADGSNAIDDSLMAEFAAAVEGQKSGTLEEAPKTDESDKLLAEFENFNKKS